MDGQNLAWPEVCHTSIILTVRYVESCKMIILHQQCDPYHRLLMGGAAPNICSTAKSMNPMSPVNPIKPINPINPINPKPLNNKPLVHNLESRPFTFPYAPLPDVLRSSWNTVPKSHPLVGTGSFEGSVVPVWRPLGRVPPQRPQKTTKHHRSKWLTFWG